MTAAYDPLNDPLLPSREEPFVAPAPSAGFEFPSDPDAQLPLPAVNAQPVTPAGTSWGAAMAASEPPVTPSFPVTPVAPPSFPQAPQVAPSYATTPPSANFPAPVAPPAEVDVESLIGFNPETLTAPAPGNFVAPPAAPPVAPVAPAFVAPVVPTPVASVPVYDPRGHLAPEDIADSFAMQPKEQLVSVEGRPELERYLAGLVNNGGSDLHLKPGEVPRYRVSGALLPIAGEPVLTGEDIERMLSGALNQRAWAEYMERGDLDTAYAMDQSEGAAVTSRFRVNVYREMAKTGAVFRIIPTNIVTLDQLGIPSQVKGLASKPRGLILFCGPTGSGKSTSMAGLVDLINETREERIFTLEDPIEFVHSSKKCLISHREIGEDTQSFEEGLRRVRREDPDIILIGEMRDYETIAAAIEAADTGHLVIGTLHTNSAPETISRIINSFPAERQEQIRITLSSCLLAVICQTLVPSPLVPRGRVLAAEIMMVTPGVANNIRENDIPAIANALTDRTSGSLSLDAHLVELIHENKITKKEALKKASSPEALERQLGNTTN